VASRLSAIAFRSSGSIASSCNTSIVSDCYSESTTPTTSASRLKSSIMPPVSFRKGNTDTKATIATAAMTAKAVRHCALSSCLRLI
ncbi:MAG: hypothetical protein K2H99_08555, partial [Paramuribaculum sp.]|nr:hypothetical protein [Paramuribaculum sp.]